MGGHVITAETLQELSGVDKHLEEGGGVILSTCLTPVCKAVVDCRQLVTHVLKLISHCVDGDHVTRGIWKGE